MAGRQAGRKKKNVTIVTEATKKKDERRVINFPLHNSFTHN